MSETKVVPAVPRELKTEVASMLKALNDLGSADAIGEHLATMGVKGGHNPLDCPVAVYVATGLGQRWPEWAIGMHTDLTWSSVCFGVYDSSDSNPDSTSRDFMYHQEFGHVFGFLRAHDTENKWGLEPAE